MSPKRLAVLCGITLLAGSGCTGNRLAEAAVPAPAAVSAAAAEPTVVSKPLPSANVPTPGNAGEPASTPAPETLTPSSAQKQTAPEEVTFFPEEAGVALENTAPAAAREPGAEDLVKQARARQTLREPAPDKASFKGEEPIPLKDRLLSPMAYEPVRPEGDGSPWSGEELKYGVYYSFIKAGTAYIKNRGITTVNGRRAHLIQTTAFSASVIDAFFKVRDVNYSWIDAENFYSLGYSQSVREGGYKRDEWLAFDYENNRFYGELQKKEAPRVLSGPLSQRVLDMLSSLYFVRAQKLEKGKDIVFDIINREKQYPLVVKVLGKETIKTAAGKFDCILVEPQFRGEGIFVSKGKSLKVWLTDDEYKMPVKMKTEVFIGSVSAELLEYKRN